MSELNQAIQCMIIQRAGIPAAESYPVTANSSQALEHAADNTQVAALLLVKAANIFPGPSMQSQVSGLIVQI